MRLCSCLRAGLCAPTNEMPSQQTWWNRGQLLRLLYERISISISCCYCMWNCQPIVLKFCFLNMWSSHIFPNMSGLNHVSLCWLLRERSFYNCGWLLYWWLSWTQLYEINRFKSYVVLLLSILFAFLILLASSTIFSTNSIRPSL